MNKQQFIKWAIEVANESYNGKVTKPIELAKGLNKPIHLK